MFVKCRWTNVDTIVPKEKVSRHDEDTLFLKLPNEVRLPVQRGLFQEASIKLKAPWGGIIICNEQHGGIRNKYVSFK